MRVSVWTAKRGGGAARLAPLLALLFITVASLEGCQRAVVAPSSPRFVRVDALLPLHPAWEQVVSLDKTMSEFTARPPLSGQVAPDLPPLPGSFAPPPAIPPTLPQQRRQRTRDYEAQYLQQLGETLRLQDEAYLTRLGRRLQQEAEAQYQKELAEREAAIRAEHLRQAADLDRQTSLLRIRDVAFQTQIKVYGQRAPIDVQSLNDAQLQHTELLRQIDALVNQADVLVSPATIARLAQTALGNRHQEVLAQAVQKLEQERQTLAARRADRVKQEQSKLVYEPDPLPSIDATPFPALDERETPLALPPGSQATAAMQAADGRVKQAAGQQKIVWQAQRKRLIAAIRADMQQAVEQVARQRGWTLAAPNARDAQDATDEIRPLVRAQWQQARQE